MIWRLLGEREYFNYCYKVQYSPTFLLFTTINNTENWLGKYTNTLGLQWYTGRKDYNKEN